MGIVNCTPDSFFAGSRRATVREAVDAALNMVEAGADFLDIGGESSRPGSEPVAADEEMSRILPVIRQLAKETTVPLSVDTCKAVVARQALGEGAAIINDISALQFDPDMATLAAQLSVPVILMHMKGEPKSMQVNPQYDDVVVELLAFFRSRLQFAHESGIHKENVVLDPGIGFGKRVDDNYQITANLDSFVDLGCPILFGASRKSFLSKIVGGQPQECLAATVAINTVAILRGAHILRVHDVQEAKQAAAIIDHLVHVTVN